jgi:hypothetical protein
VPGGVEAVRHAAVSPGMVKFVLPRAPKRAFDAQILPRANHAAPAPRSRTQSARRPVDKILSKVDPVAFDEKSRRIRVDIGQKPRFISNDSFKLIC